MFESNDLYELMTGSDEVQEVKLFYISRQEVNLEYHHLFQDNRFSISHSLAVKVARLDFFVVLGR